MASMYGRVMSSPKLTNRRNNTATCFGLIGTCVSAPSAPRSQTVHPFFSSTSHSMKAPITSGRDCSMAPAEAFEGPRAGYGFGTGRATIAGCESSAARYGDSGT